MRALQTLSMGAIMQMHEGQKLYKENGMNKSVVIVASSEIAKQFTSIARKTGIYAWERYINSVHNFGWEKAAMDWLLNGIDPDE